MPSFGPKPDHESRRLVDQLRAEGLTYEAIGKQLGITTQAARHLATYPLMYGGGVARCRSCKAVLRPGVYAYKSNSGVLCLACLAKKKNPSFQDRLRTYRLAAGLSRDELAELAGLKRSVIDYCEVGTCHDPKLSIAKRLAAVLSVGLLGLEDLGEEPGKPSARQEGK